MKKRRLKYIIGFIIIGGTFSYLAWESFRASFQYSITPSEFVAMDPQMKSRRIRISGTIETGSLVVDGMDHRFRIADERGQSIEVHYKGIAPNTLREGVEVMVSGEFDSKVGRFEANELLAKCASKYEGK